MIAGTYIAVGVTMPPQVRLLPITAINLLNDRLRINRDAALIATFGLGCDYCFECNNAMLCYLIEQACKDNIPHAGELATIALALISGKPFSKGKDITEGNGGIKVKAPKVPKGSGPVGAQFDKATLSALNAFQEEGKPTRY